MDFMSIILNAIVPFEIAIGVSSVCIVVTIFAVLKRQPGAVFRFLGALLLSFMLFDPGLVIEEREPIKDIAVLLLDETPSQKLGNRDVKAKDIAAKIQDNLAGFEKNIDIRVARVTHQSISEAEKGTRLIDALRHSVSDIPKGRLAGAIMITDGQVHDFVASEDITQIFPAPIHSIITGSPGEKDRRLEIIRSSGYGLVGQSGEISLKVHDEGFNGPPAELLMSVDGKTIGQETVQVGEEHHIRIPLSKRGKTVVSLIVSTVDGELTDKNNRAVVSINAVRDRLRVLLISGVPHPGERTWRNLLKADPSVDLVHFTILRPPEKQDGTPIHELSLIAFPTRELFETKLNDFDLIVFDRYRRRGVLPTLYLSNIVQYVKDGGALLEVGGPGFAGPFSLYQSPLAELLPGEPTGAVIERGFQPKLTEDGLRHPVTSQLPGGPLISLKDDVKWGRWFRQVEVASRGGHTLMEGLEENPLLILDRVQEGRVAQLSSDHIWLWSHGFEGGGPHGEFIRRLSHWLMKEPELEENSLDGYVDGNQLVIEMRSLLTIDPLIDITSPDGSVTSLRLKHKGNGRYLGALPVTDVGLYKLDDGDKSLFVPVGALNPLEYERVIADDSILVQATKPTGGGVYWAKENLPKIRHVNAGRLMSSKDWLGLRKNNDYRVTGVERVSLIPGILALILIVGTMLLAWRKEAE